MSERPDAILIAGPTASGKTRLAVEHAQSLAATGGGEIVNADSMQVYDALPVLTAQPTDAERGATPHHLFGHVPPAHAYSVAQWLAAAGAKLTAIGERGRVPIVVGGTGLYFKALLDGLAAVPPVDPEIRADVRRAAEQEGAAALHRQLAIHDPDTAATLRPSDTQRIARALEVQLSTGRSLASFQADAKVGGMLDGWRVDATIIMPERSLLHRRIEARSITMLTEGAIEEVEALLAQNLPPETPVMKAIGVSQIAAYLCGEIDSETLLARLQAATRQYAKRQCTFLRGQFDERWRWLEPASMEYYAK